MKSGKGFSSDLISYSFRIKDGIQRYVCEEYIYDLFKFMSHFAHFSELWSDQNCLWRQGNLEENDQSIEKFSYLIILTICSTIQTKKNSWLPQKLFVWKEECGHHHFSKAILFNSCLNDKALGIPLFYSGQTYNIHSFPLFSCSGQLNRWPCHSLIE